MKVIYGYENWIAGLSKFCPAISDWIKLVEEIDHDFTILRYKETTFWKYSLPGWVPAIELGLKYRQENLWTEDYRLFDSQGERTQFKRHMIAEQPQLPRPPACIGCISYHGKDNIICGIHPYGAVGEEATCSDWEGEDDDS